MQRDCFYVWRSVDISGLSGEHLGTELVLTGEVWCLQSFATESMANRNQQH